MAPSWKIVGSSTFTPVEPPPEPLAFELRGDKSTIVLPLAWPISKTLEERLLFLDSQAIVAAFQALLPGKTDEPAFPEDDDDLPPLTTPDGDPYPWPWTDKKSGAARASDWEWVYRWWYYDNRGFSRVDLTKAFGEAIEVLTGLPLEQCAPSLQRFITNEPTGLDDSGSTDESTSNGSKTGRRSTRSRTTS